MATDPVTRHELSNLRAELAAYLARRGAAPEEAEDIVQDAFVRFARAGHETTDPDARPLLFVICRNLMSDHWRSAGRERARRSSLSPDAMELAGEAVASEVPAPDRRTLAREELARAADVIRGLPPRTRDAFLLHRFEEMTYRQIADRMGVSVSMVEKHLAEAMRRLKSARSD